MRVFRNVLIGLSALVLLSAPVFAGHVRPGLWSIVTSTRYSGFEQMSPIARARMAANGVTFPRNATVTNKQFCISVEDAAVDRLPRTDQNSAACSQMIYKPSSDGYTGTSTCVGYFKGDVAFDVGFGDDAHYNGKAVFRGKFYDLDIITRTKFAGEWSGSDCGAAH